MAPGRARRQRHRADRQVGVVVGKIDVEGTGPVGHHEVELAADLGDTRRVVRSVVVRVVQDPDADVGRAEGGRVDDLRGGEWRRADEGGDCENGDCRRMMTHGLPHELLDADQ
jgi:hypothetical protein